MLFFRVIYFILDYLNMYLNSKLIPKSLKWDESGHLKENLGSFKFAQILISNIESLLFMVLLYFFNKWFLTKIIGIEKARLISIWFSVLLFVIMFVISL